MAIKVVVAVDWVLAMEPSCVWWDVNCVCTSLVVVDKYPSCVDVVADVVTRPPVVEINALLIVNPLAVRVVPVMACALTTPATLADVKLAAKGTSFLSRLAVGMPALTKLPAASIPTRLPVCTLVNAVVRFAFWLS